MIGSATQAENETVDVATKRREQSGIILAQKQVNDHKTTRNHLNSID